MAKDDGDSSDAPEPGDGESVAEDRASVAVLRPVSKKEFVGGSSIVTARGTGDGLILRLDGRVEWNGLKDAIQTFVRSREGFLSGQDVSLEWVGVEPEEKVLEDLKSLLLDKFGVVVKGSALKQSRLEGSRLERNVKEDNSGTDKTVSSLFGGLEDFGAARDLDAAPEGIDSYGVEALHTGDDSGGVDPGLWDDPNARIVYGTMRSGQKVETEHSLIVVGDVNSGAEIVAGGDIMVMGKLRGVAHAGAYDETGGGRFIFALRLLPTQLRIGMVISRGATEAKGDVDTITPEVARVDGNNIAVEPYKARMGLIK